MGDQIPGGDDAPLTEEAAEAAARGAAFTAAPPRRIGIELEWLVCDRADPRLPVPVERTDVLARFEAEDRPGLSRGGRLTREPGGQVELSTRPAESLAACVADAAADAAVLRGTLASRSVVLTGLGLEPFRDPPRVLEYPRYRAMEAYFDRLGPWGRMMMRGTAGVQVNLDAGLGDGFADSPTGYRRRWLLAHRLGPVLVAAFANSPLWQGRPTGWCSTRQLVWSRLDPPRTEPVAFRHGSDPAEAWARRALDAGVLCIPGGTPGDTPGSASRRVDGDRAPEDWTAPAGLTFRSWLRHPGEVGRAPTRADLDYHLTTLFPPVRPRGWLELRMLDAQPGDGWAVPVAVAAALFADPVAQQAAWDATEPLCRAQGGGLGAGRVSAAPSREVWLRAARSGPADPELARAALACLSAAESSLAADPATAALARAVGVFTETHTERGRCPADVHLDALGIPRTPRHRPRTWTPHPVRPRAERTIG